MKNRLKILIMTILVVICTRLVSGQEGYSDFNQLSRKIGAFQREYPGLCSVKSIGKTATGKDIWLITVGSGDRDNKPAIAVIGGVEGNYLLGRELAAGIAGNLLKNSASEQVSELLSTLTFYFIPDVNPDASSQFSSAVKYERNLNSVPADDDKDFKVNEDPAEDLNRDGIISLVRVADPAGTFIESPDDKRVMVKADLSRGETGGYLVLSEGTDNDGDEKWNEDGEGGVNFNRNFTFNYEEFGQGAGLHPVSEPESKAVADFLFDRFNIFSVFTFGPQDNLGQPMKAQEQSGRNVPAQAAAQSTGSGQGRTRMNRKFTSILGSDEKINKLVSDKYHEITGLKGSPATRNDAGNFMEWAYFHYGRYSFSTPGWWFPAEKGKNPEAEFLKYADKQGITDAFIPWKEFSHPDFPGKKAEIGGIKPFVMTNPPADSIGSLVDSHYRFITSIAAMHPKIEFIDVKTEDAGENIFRLTLKIHNAGIFATCSEAGDQNIWTRIMRITLNPGKNQAILSGQRVQRIPRLQGDETAEFSWLISGKGQIEITAGAANTGTITHKADLK